MPPKPRFTKEEIAAVALKIVKEEGVSALTARELGKRLGTSARPVFTTFRNMEEVKLAAREIALQEFENYIGDFTEYKPAFKRIGMQMVSYAINEPELYKLLFMQEHIQKRNFNDIIPELGNMSATCIVLIQRDYSLTKEEAMILFEQMWIHTFGIGALCALKVCDFTTDEIAKELGQVLTGLLMMIKGGQLNAAVGQPHRLREQKND